MQIEDGRSREESLSHRDEELYAWLRLAEEAVRGAGEYLAQAAMTGARVTAESGRDVKLEADHISEAHILDVLHRRSDFWIHSEERGVVGGLGDDDLCWIVDPLDGSFNYLRGIPSCCVSVGLWRKNEPLLGTIYDFKREELFAGIVGVGAWLNEAPIHVGCVREPGCAVLCTGFPVDTDFSPDALSQFVNLVRAYKKIRILGSAALSLAYVAAGRADVYYERDIKLWDVAAGAAIVLAAGGRVLRSESDKKDAVTLYAGPPSMPALYP